MAYLRGGAIPNWNPEPGTWYMQLHTNDEIHIWEQVQPVNLNNTWAAGTVTFNNPPIYGYNLDDEVRGQVTAAIQREAKVLRPECCCGDREDPYWEHDIEECTWREPVDRPKRTPTLTPTITVNTSGIRDQLTITNNLARFLT